MMKMNRICRTLLCLLALLMALLPLAGCHGARKAKPISSTPPAAMDESQPIEITFWAKNDTNVRQTRIYKKAISDFEALYPHIKVKLTLYTDYARIYQDVITNIPTGTTPNVCITYPDHIATYKEGEGVVLPLDGWISDKKYGLGGSELRFDGVKKDEIIEKFLDEGKLDGAQYALPYMRSTEACYINKTYVEALGYTVPDLLTWDFIWEVSEAAMRKNADGTFAVNGQKTLIPFIYKSSDNMMIQYLRQAGAGFSDDAGNVLLFNDTTESFLTRIAEHAFARSFSTFKISGYPGNYLNKGQCIFAIDSTAGATWMGTNAPLSDMKGNAKIEFETVVRPIPQVNPKQPTMISQGPSVCVFNRENEQEVLASWLFAQFLLTNDVQIGYAQTEGYVPVTSKAQSSDTYRTYLASSGIDNDVHYSVKIDATKLLLENIDNTFITSVFNGSADLREAGGQMIEEVTKASRRKETVDAAYLTALREKIISLYHLNPDQIRKDFHSIPTPAILLLSVLGAAWLGMGIYVGVGWFKKRRQCRNLY